MLEDMFQERQFIESLPFSEMKPSNGILSNQNNYCFCKAGDVYAVFFPAGGSDFVNLSKVQGDFDVFWFNPRNGEKTQMSSVTGGGKRAFATPDNNDWVLHLDNTQVQGSLALQYDKVSFVTSDNTFVFYVYLPLVMECDY